MATCGICNDDFSDDEIMTHLSDYHDVDTRPVTWPDGEPVIVDHTLDPEDFESV
jgi:hypothetical protein